MNPKVDAFLERQEKWRAEFEKLREILLDSGLTEELKWGHPCYTLNGKNVVLIHGFKEYCAILFNKGALMKDPPRRPHSTDQERASSPADSVCERPRGNQAREDGKSLCARGDRDRARRVEGAVQKDGGIHVARGARIQARQKREAAGGLRRADARSAARAYIFHFSQPKLTTTRAARVEKNIPRILEGLGLDD